MSKQYYQAEGYVARTSIGYLVKRANALMLDSIEPAFAKEDFTFMQWVVLMHLRDGIALNPKHICGEFRHDSGALSRVIDQLEKRGFLERSRSKLDRRQVELHLTTPGRDAVNALLPLVVDHLNIALSDFSHSEASELIRLLGKLNTNMEAHLNRLVSTVVEEATS